MIKKILGILVVMLLILMMIPISISSDATFGKTIYVDDDGGADYTRIQDAIDAASDGDTIYVYGGIYYENLVVDKSLNLVGEDLFDSIIDGDEKGNVINISADWVNISGFTIQNSMNYYYCSGIEIKGDIEHCTGHCTIDGNRIVNNSRGIYVRCYSSNTVVKNNIISDNVYSGMSLSGSNNNVISGNIISDNVYSGMSLSGSNNNVISGNIISDNGYWGMSWGMNLYSSDDNVVTDNNFFNDGVKVGGSDSHYNHNIFLNNFVNGKPLIYLENISNDGIDANAGQVILVGCNNIIVQDLEISNTNIGICMFHSDNCQIMGNNISDNDYAVFMEYSTFNDIEDNFIDNNDRGIYIEDYSYCNNIENNVISNNDYGIILGFLTNKSTIAGNIISKNQYGIVIDVGDSNTIDYNEISNNDCGITVTNLRFYVYYEGDFMWFVLGNNKFTHNNFIDNIKHADFIDYFMLYVYFGSLDAQEKHEIIKRYCLTKQDSDLGVKDAHWLSLQEYLKHIEKPLRTGIFPINFHSVEWNNNYWDDHSSIGRKRINGMKYISCGVGNKEIDFEIPWLNFDRHPAKEPYVIP